MRAYDRAPAHRSALAVLALLGLAALGPATRGAAASTLQDPKPAAPEAKPAAAPAPKIPWRPIPSPVPDDEEADAVAIVVKRAYTVSGDPIDGATILVRGGKIAAIGKIVDVPKGTRRLHWPELVAMPGLVVAQSRAGITSRASTQGAATKGRDLVDPDAPIFREALAAGITAMAVGPAGNGFVGQASVLRTRGESLDDRVLADAAYVLCSFPQANTNTKDAVRKTLEKAKQDLEKFEKAKEEYEKAKKAAEAAPKTEKKDPAPDPKPAPTPAPDPKPAPKPEPDPKPEPKPEPPKPEAKPGSAPAAKPPVEPKLDPKIEPIIQILKAEKKCVVDFDGGRRRGGFGGPSPAAELLHFQDAVKGFVMDRIFSGGPNLALVADRIAEEKSMALLPSDELDVEPYTRNRRSAVLELRKAGITVSLLPPDGDGRESFQGWLLKLGLLVRDGLPEADALRAVTLGPAEMLGVADRIGSLQTGRDADILFFAGHPFDASSKLVHVMVEGEIVPEEEL